MPDDSVDYDFHPDELMLVLTHRYFKGLIAYNQTVIIRLPSSIGSLPSSFPCSNLHATLILSPGCRMPPRAFVPEVLARGQT